MRCAFGRAQEFWCRLFELMDLEARRVCVAGGIKWRAVSLLVALFARSLCAFQADLRRVCVCVCVCRCCALRGAAEARVLFAWSARINQRRASANPKGQHRSSSSLRAPHCERALQQRAINRRSAKAHSLFLCFSQRAQSTCAKANPPG